MLESFLVFIFANIMISKESSQTSNQTFSSVSVDFGNTSEMSRKSIERTSKKVTILLLLAKLVSPCQTLIKAQLRPLNKYIQPLHLVPMKHMKETLSRTSNPHVVSSITTQYLEVPAPNHCNFREYFQLCRIIQYHSPLRLVTSVKYLLLFH